ncbi:MAG: toll/interleukin-1 receptor domain-containing protein [Magnetococcales bacterium]|nr:toll/interleukin-1 receptor domain-containing protein [Magnetococcales bacterium]
MSDPVDLFISYAHEDEAYKDELVKFLKVQARQKKIRLWTDRNIKVGEKWQPQIIKALQQSQMGILLISADFLASDFIQDEEVPQLLEQHRTGRTRLVPIIIRECNWEQAHISKYQVLPKDGNSVKSYTDPDRAWKEITDKIVEIADELASVPATPASVTCHHNLSSRNPLFTGREEVLRQLAQGFATTATQALTQTIHGLGGIGKTQTALEYAHRHLGEYQRVWWLAAETEGGLSAGFDALARELGCVEGDIEAKRRFVHDWLNREKDWLLIFDNAEAPEALHPWLPLHPKGHLLITSRHHDWEEASIALAIWRLEESVAFLLNRTKRQDETGAKRVAKLLGYLPLALTQAAAYLAETSMPFGDYASLFEKQTSPMLHKGKKLRDYPATLATTWAMAMDRLSPESKELLNLFSLLAPETIPLDLLRPYLGMEETTFWEAIGGLRRHSLVEVKEKDLAIHRLVQLVTRERMGVVVEQANRYKAVKLLRMAFSFKQADLETWPPSERLFPHVLVVTAPVEWPEEQKLDLARLLNEAGVFLSTMGRYSQMLELQQRAFRLAEEVLPAEDRQLAVFANNLCQILQALGRLKEALPYAERALAIDEKVHGPDHPKVALRANNLGAILKDLGRPDEALSHMQRALAIGKKVHGPDHPQVALYANNLGIVLQALGRLDEALPHAERALAIDEKVYGPDDPMVAKDVNNLGVILLGLGRLEEVLPHVERALAIGEQVHGSDHPNVALFANNLGEVLQDLGRLPEARTRLQRAFEIRLAKLPAGHPYIALTANNLIILLEEMHLPDEAAEVRRRLEENSRKASGSV